MINDVKVRLETDKKAVKIIINEKTKSSININNKVINTKDIYKMLNYNVKNKYKLDCTRLKEEDTQGKDNEINRLYNYVYDLFQSIIDAINDINLK